MFSSRGQWYEHAQHLQRPVILILRKSRWETTPVKGMAEKQNRWIHALIFYTSLKRSKDRPGTGTLTIEESDLRKVLHMDKYKLIVGVPLQPYHATPSCSIQMYKSECITRSCTAIRCSQRIRCTLYRLSVSLQTFYSLIVWRHRSGQNSLRQTSLHMIRIRVKRRKQMGRIRALIT